MTGVMVRNDEGHVYISDNVTGCTAYHNRTPIQWIQHFENDHVWKSFHYCCFDRRTGSERV